MKKQVFYPREKLLSTDLNASIVDTDYFVREMSLNTIINNPSSTYRNIIIDGLTGSVTGPASISIVVSAGIAYHGGTITAPDFGRMVRVPANVTLSWDGTNATGFPANPNFRRIDIVCVKHNEVNSATAARFFIDSNPASPTYGQQIVNNVTTEQDDSYTFFVVTGTPAANPTIPAVITGYIPLFLVYVHSSNDLGAPLIFQNPCALAHFGSWRANHNSDIDNYYFQDQNKLTLAELEDKTFNIPIKQSFGASPARPSVVITPSWTDGYPVLSDICDVVSAEFVSHAAFVGVGLNDLTSSGIYTGAGTTEYRVQIDGVNTFRWSDTNGAIWNFAGVAITGVAQLLNNGVYVTFAAVPGHTVNDYWNFYATDYNGQPVYGADNTDPAVIENLIFGVVSSVVPGAVTVTFHKGDPNIPSPILSNCNIPIEATYPLHVKLKDLPADVFRNEFQTGLSVDMNLEKRIEDLEDGTSLDPLYLRRDIDTTGTLFGSNPLDRSVSVRSDLFIVPNAAPFIVTTTGVATRTAICTELNAHYLYNLMLGQTGPLTGGGTSYIPYADSNGNVGIGVVPAANTRLSITKNTTVTDNYGIQIATTTTGAGENYGIYTVLTGSGNSNIGYRCRSTGGTAILHYGLLNNISGALNHNYGVYSSLTSGNVNITGEYINAVAAGPATVKGFDIIANAANGGAAYGGYITVVGASSSVGLSIIAASSLWATTGIGVDVTAASTLVTAVNAYGPQMIAKLAYRTAVAGSDYYSGYFNTTSSGANNYGVYTSATGAGTTNYGIRNETAGATTNYGIYSVTSGAATTNYGIYVSATGAGTNWAGWFIGNVNITGTVTIGTAVRLMAISAASFKVLSYLAGTAYSYQSNYDTLDYTDGGAGGTLDIVSPVEFPHGATITGMTLAHSYKVDVGTMFVQMVLFRKARMGAYGTAGTIMSFDSQTYTAPTGDVDPADDISDAASTYTIDNLNYRYWIWVYIAATNIFHWKLQNIRFDYTVTQPLP